MTERIGRIPGAIMILVLGVPSLFGAMAVPSLVASAGMPAGSSVADAAERGDVQAVRTLLYQGADVNAAQGDGMTALHWAAYNGDVESTRMLIYAGASLVAITRIGNYTPLHLASRGGSGAVVGTLLEAGADPTAITTAGGASPLHFAAAAGSAEAITLLLDHGADVDARESSWSQTALIFAAANNRVDALDVLLRRGAEVSATTRVLDVPAHDRALKQAKERRDQRLAALQDPNPEVEDPAEEGKDPIATEQSERGSLAGQLVGNAAGQEHDREQPPSESTKELIETEEEARLREEAEGLPPSYPELVGSHGGLTALLHAAREGYVDAVLSLLEAGADIDQVSTGDHTSPLVIAVINGHFDLAMQLLELRADPALANDGGVTALFATINTHWAPKSRYPQQYAYKQQQTTYLQLTQALLEAGADPNVRLTKHLWFLSYNFHLLGVDTKGATPFWRAAYATDVAAMRLLAAYGSDSNIPTQKIPPRRRYADSGTQGKADPSGLALVPVGGPAVYPIHAASGAGYGEGYAGNSHRHVPEGWMPSVRWLVEELGADVNARDHNGYAPLHHAAARGDNEMVQYLVDHGADVTVVSRRGQTTVDMANGPVQRIQPFRETIELLENLGAENNHNCLSC